MEDRINGGQGLMVIGVLYHGQPDPARAFAARMQASAWPEGMKIESLWLALDCVKLRDGARAGRAHVPPCVAGREAGRAAATDQRHPARRHAALWKN